MSEQENTPQAVMQNEKPANGSVLLGLVAGLVVAFVCGGVWAWLTLTIGYEIGYMAVGVGLLCGFAVVLVGKGRGLWFQLTAVLSSLLSVLIAKYMIFFYVASDIWNDQNSVDTGTKLTLFSAEVMQEFVADFTQLFGRYDLLWMLIAVVIAWRVAQQWSD